MHYYFQMNFFGTLNILWIVIMMLVSTIGQINNHTIGYAEAETCPRYGGTLRIGMFIEPTLIHPIYTTYSRAMDMCDLIFSQLIYLDEETNPMPDLATRWEISDDGLVYTFYLRDDVFFHDGVQLTAEDVKFTYDAIINPANESPFRTAYLDVARIDAVSRFKIRITLAQRKNSFIKSLDRGIIPKHAFASGNLKNEAFLAHPVGSGMFRFSERKANGEVVLSANEQYYKHRPYLDHVYFKRLNSTVHNESSFLRQEIDMINFLSYTQFKHLEKDPAFKCYAVETDYYYALMYDLNDPMLNDVRVRRAIAHAVSLERVITDAAYGYGTPCYGPFHPQTEGFNPDATPLTYDPKKAAALLDECGFVCEDGALFRSRDNKEIELRIAANVSDAYHEEIIKSIMLQLAEVGIKVTYILRDEYYENEHRLEGNSLDYNVYLGTLFSGGDINYAVLYWSSEYQRQPKLSDFKHSRLNFLIEKAKGCADNAERKKTYKEIYSLITNEQLAGFLFFIYDFHAIGRKFSNVENYFTASMPTYAIKNFYIEDDDCSNNKTQERR